MVEVVGTEEFDAWYQDLDESDTKAVTRAVDVLGMRGVSLGSPQSSEIKGTRYAFRELRVQSGGKPLRIYYAFDPKRQAVLVLGGDKTGDARFYERMTRLAEQVWERYLHETQ